MPAGEYTVCFCDSGASGGTRPCGRTEDYGLEIGRVIASGVSCLLDLPQHRCVEQKMGGLRCESASTGPARLTLNIHSRVGQPGFQCQSSPFQGAKKAFL